MALPRLERKRDRRHGVEDDSGEVRVVRLHSRYRPHTTQPASAAAPRAPLTFRYPVGLYRQNKCMDPHRHRQGLCRHVPDFPVGFSLRGPQDAPIRHRVDWMSWRVRPRPTRTSQPRPGDACGTTGI